MKCIVNKVTTVRDDVDSLVPAVDGIYIIRGSLSQALYNFVILACSTRQSFENTITTSIRTFAMQASARTDHNASQQLKLRLILCECNSAFNKSICYCTRCFDTSFVSDDIAKAVSVCKK